MPQPELPDPIYLHSGKTIYLAQTPVPLYVNEEFTLTLRVEQDPLKTFPFRDMCTEHALEWIQENEGLSREQLIPFLVQMRGLWNLEINPDLPRNSVFRNVNVDQPNSPDAEFGPNHILDRWHGERAFRVGVRIVVGDEEEVVVLPAPTGPSMTGKHVVLRHDGSPSNTAQSTTDGVGYAVVPDPPGRPFEAAFAWAKPGDGGNHLGENGVWKEEGGGTGWDYSVEWDGYCITTIRIHSKGRPVRVGLHVEQDEIHAPGGWGVNSHEEVECHLPVQTFEGFGEGVVKHICTIKNGLPYCMGNHGRDGIFILGSFPENPGLGAAFATRSMYWVTDWENNFAGLGLPPPRDTPWQGNTTFSLDNDEYDWTTVGNVNLRSYLQVLGFGWIDETDLNTLDPENSTIHRRAGFVRSPSTCGYPDISLDALGAFIGQDPFVSGVYLFYDTVNPSLPTTGWNRIVDVIRRWYQTATTRLAEFNHVTEPPKVKISATWEIAGAEVNIPETKQHYYGALPFEYQADAARLEFEDVYTFIDEGIFPVQPIENVTITQNSLDNTSMPRRSDDRFSGATIGAAMLNCIFILDRNGLACAWQKSLEGFDGDSTIPENQFAQGEDTFIYDLREPNRTYQDWLGLTADEEVI